MALSYLFTQFDPVFFEKTRLSIITVIYREKNVAFNRLKKVLNQTDGALYSHLKKLLAAGYLQQKKEITPENSVQTIYSLTSKGVDTFAGYLKFIEELLNERSHNDG